MPFIRAKYYNMGPRATKEAERRGREPTRTYYYLVESYREGGKVRQRMLAYLGRYPTPEDALARIQGDLERDERWLTSARESLAKAIEERDKAQARLGCTFQVDESSRSHWTWQERWFREDQRKIAEKTLPRALRKVQEQEAHVRFCERGIAQLQALSEQLQALGYQCSAEKREEPARLHQEREARFQTFANQARAILGGKRSA